MLQCPTCDQTLDQDFGMVTCQKCQAVLMIDISGNVQVGGEYIPSEDDDHDGETDPLDDDHSFTGEQDLLSENNFEPTGSVPMGDDDSITEYPEQSELTAGASDFGANEGDSLFPSFESTSFDDEEAQAEEELADDESSYCEEEGAEYEDDENDQADEDNFDADSVEVGDESDEEVSVAAGPSHSSRDYEEEDEFEEEEDFPGAPATVDSSPVDITQYANSEKSSLEEGELLYDLTIRRLDSKELKEVLKFVLMDKKLKLNYRETMKNIVDGKLSITDLNPIKAKRIVEQLQFYDLDVRWRQKRVVMDVVEPEIEGEAEVGL